MSRLRSWPVSADQSGHIVQAIAHLAAGVAAVSLVSLGGEQIGHPLEPSALPLYYGLGMVSALLPDIDHLSSTLGRQAKWIAIMLLVGVVVAMVTMGPRLPMERVAVLLTILCYYLAAVVGGHRSPWTHSVWPWLGGSIGLTILVPWIQHERGWFYGADDAGLVFAAAYGSHLLLDSFTRQGIPFLWPWVDRRLGFRLVTTGGKPETFVTIFCLGLAVLPLLWP
ncbi:metal-dependent hydrolase [Magnetospirillum molischianum]|uniref:Putative Membrane-bound metal-dependent hydrolase n=1 Tax=Magnetospirillum molischianum DSM 120 TaxID=1150626 RepID=H8FR85_MAGML|nr:metal-dependent hydrolase [Magnetospirillum molischianum]CCG40873.1 putative Membrane-bound metal-dependent hydrolase [Magnetospirillum molischianum DSM 120]